MSEYDAAANSAGCFADAIAAIRDDYLRNRRDGETAEDYMRRAGGRYMDRGAGDER